MKNKSIVKILVLAAFISGALFSCTYETITRTEPEVPDSVSFSVDIIPIFNASCNVSGCHSKGGIAPDLTEQNAYISLIFFGYIDTDVPEESIVYEKINTGSMKTYATDTDRALILKWIEQGALDN